ncbi:MAG: carbohydrate ABC transporter permease [Phototrophicales bacterium]|nr:MAG: carbohydrate ABC transporter permease [Phototrophicales bacterium]
MATHVQHRSTIESYINTSPFYGLQLKKLAMYSTVTLFACIILMGFLMPFAYAVVTASKSEPQIKSGTVLPYTPQTFRYEGKDLPLYEVPLPDGTTQVLAGLNLKRGDNAKNEFIDPDNPSEVIIWEGNWRKLKAVEVLEIHLLENFDTVWNNRQTNFPVMLRNTFAIAVLGMIGTLLSCISVAYAFARFPIPRKRALFLILVSTIILPSQVTLVPTFGFFATIGWTGTWLPLIVPHFFANAYNVFLLRQYFLTLPKELDEAAMIDGAGPFRILVSVIIPQSLPVIVSVAIFHLVFAWNDYFMPLIYLLGKEDLLPISVGIQRFNFVYDMKPHLLQSSMLIGLIVPVLIFLFAQRFFMRGVVITGVEK